MGKAAKWFRGFLGLKSPDSSSPTTYKPPKEKRRWSFVKSYREKEDHHLHHLTTTKPSGHHTINVAVPSSQHEAGSDPDKHAIAVAAATAAVAEAAVAAAQAAAAVVRLTSSGRSAGNAVLTPGNASTDTGIREEWAAIKIQAAFRGCLARKALRALKGLVKLQALVRGHIERKRTAEWLQRMQVLLRAQARARVGRAQTLQTSAKPSNSQPSGPATPDKFESPIRSKSLKNDQTSVVKRNGLKSNVLIGANQERLNRLDSRVDEQSWNGQRSRTCSADDEKCVRVLEIDSGKPHLRENRRNLFHSAHYASLSDQYGQSLTTTYLSGHSLSSSEVQSYSPLKIDEVEESPFRTADSSPQFYSASSRDVGSKTSPFTPSRSDGSRSYASGYSDHPSYMAFTESSKAKVRSLSAPKQRPPNERSSSSNRYALHGTWESRLAAQRASAMHASFTSKAYPGSGRLDKLGMPVGYRL